MKNEILKEIVYWGQIAAMIMIWYWFSKDNRIISIAAGAIVLITSLLSIVKPDLCPNRGTLILKRFPEALHKLFRIYFNFLASILAIFIILNYRLENIRTMGIIGLIFFVPLLLFHIVWLIIGSKEEVEKYMGFSIFSIIVSAIFILFCLLFVNSSEKGIELFEDHSPWPMMVFFLILGIVQAVIFHRRERQSV